MLKKVSEISDKLEGLSGEEIRLGIKGGRVKTSRPITIMGSYTTGTKLYIVEEDETETILELEGISDVWLGDFGSTIRYKDGTSMNISWDMIGE